MSSAADDPPPGPRVLEAWLIEVARRGLWHVLVDGETIVRSARDPEHQACRALLALGVTGKVTFRHADGMAGMTMDIAAGAGLSVNDSTGDGHPRVRKFRPFGGEVAARIDEEALGLPSGPLHPSRASTT